MLLKTAKIMIIVNVIYKINIITKIALNCVQVRFYNHTSKLKKLTQNFHLTFFNNPSNVIIEYNNKNLTINNSCLNGNLIVNISNFFQNIISEDVLNKFIVH